MKLKFRGAPAHAFVCVGVFIWGACTACERGSGIGDKSARTLELSEDTIELAAGVTLHDIAVRSSSNADFSPGQIRAKTGDVVRFTTRDTRTHALLVTAPNDQGKRALQAGGQLRSPPLVARGQAWVVSLAGVAPGTYVVSCIAHAGTATIRVQ